MKISNRLFNDQQISQFSKNMSDIQKLQSKISSGKNIVFLEGKLEQNNRTVVTSTSTCVSVDMPQVNFKKMIGDNNEK